METAVLYKMIDEIDWSQYETAYGNAAQDIPHFQAGKTPSVPRSLWDLFSGDRERAIRATGDLWAGLCHQHAYVSSAALPAKAGDCIACGSCEQRCPFGVPAVENMRLAAELFGA